MPDETLKTHRHHHHHKKRAADLAASQQEGSGTLPPKPTRAAPRPALSGLSGMTGEAGESAVLPPKPTGSAPRPVNLSALSGMAGAAGAGVRMLGNEDQVSLDKMKGSKLQQLVKKTADMDDPNSEYVEPVKEEEESTGMAIAKKVAGGLWSKAEEALKNSPFGDIYEKIKTTVEKVKDAGEKVAEIVKTVKEGENKFDIAMSVAKNLLTIAKDVVAVVKEYVGDIPVIGTIFKAANAVLSFIDNMKNAIRAGRAKRRIRARKEKAKQRIMAVQGKAPHMMRDDFVTKRRARFSLSKEEGLHFDKKFAEGSRLDQLTKRYRDKQRHSPMDDLESIVDVESGETEMFEHERDAMDDVSIVDMSETTTQEEEEANGEELISALEDYDIDKELTGANKKRETDAVIKIVTDNAIPVVQALTELEPTVGASVSKGIGTAVKMFKSGRSGAKKARQFGRNHGLRGFNANKSDTNKAARRHTLAVNTFKRVKNLNALNLESMDPVSASPEQCQTVLQPYGTMQDTVEAMGMGYKPMLDAEDSDSMVGVMRNGFYRDRGEEPEEEEDDDDDD